jgi:hypothetical protein
MTKNKYAAPALAAIFFVAAYFFLKDDFTRLLKPEIEIIYPEKFIDYDNLLEAVGIVKSIAADNDLTLGELKMTGESRRRYYRDIKFSATCRGTAENIYNYISQMEEIYDVDNYIINSNEFESSLELSFSIFTES